MKFREIFYISNALSFSRVLLLVPIYYALKARSDIGNTIAVLLMVVAVITDNLDGRLARRFNQQTDFGRVLDPVADKICVAVVAFVLTQIRDMPLWFLVVVLARDAAIVVLGLFLVYKTKMVIESNSLGKATVTALALTLIVYAVNWGAAKEPLLWASVGLVAASAVSYFWRMITLLRGRGALRSSP